MSTQAWAADITHVPMARGFMYLVAVMDWHSRKILSWRLSNTLESDFCVEALQEAPQPLWHARDLQHRSGSQFTSTSFTHVLKDHGIGISMDGRGRCQDNIFVERLWWTIKHHYLYLHSFSGGSELRQGPTEWISFYNHERGPPARRPPDEVYYGLPHPFAGA